MSTLTTQYAIITCSILFIIGLINRNYLQNSQDIKSITLQYQKPIEFQQIRE